MKLNRGLLTVVGTVIFLLIAISVIGSLLIISYRSELFATEVSQAQTITSLKNAESLQVQCNGNQGQVMIKNTGTIASQILWIIVVPLNNNGQIKGPPTVYSASTLLQNTVLQPNTEVSFTLNLPANSAVGVVTAYGNLFWGGNLGGG